MKRDMDLARAILLAVEEHEDAIGLRSFTYTFGGRSHDEVAYHVLLLHEAGLIEAQSMIHTGRNGFNWMPKRLTWAGHEFLDAARDESRWSRAKKFVVEKSGGLSFELVKAVLVKWGTEAVSSGHLPF